MIQRLNSSPVSFKANENSPRNTYNREMQQNDGIAKQEARNVFSFMQKDISMQGKNASQQQGVGEKLNVIA